MPENAFTVVLQAKPATRMDVSEIELGFPNADGNIEPVIIRGLNEKVGESVIPVGLEFRVQVYADDIDKAIEKANRLADSVASFVTVVTGVGTPLVKPSLVYEITANKQEREFLQFFDNIPFANSSRKVMAKSDLTTLLRLFTRMADTEVSERIARAIRWYRFGTGTADVFDRFNAYWIGLEALNKPLQDVLQVGDDPVKCPKCGHVWVTMPTVSGIREFLKRHFPDKPDLYKRAHSLRIDIMHSKTSLSRLLNECSEIVLPTGNALLGAIYFLLSAPRPWRSYTKTLTTAAPMRMAIGARLISARIEDAMPEGGGDPHFEDIHLPVQWHTLSDGRVNMTVTSNLKAVIGEKSKGSAYRIRIYAEGGVAPQVKVDRHEVIPSGTITTGERKDSEN
jgi:hypothetical protein